MARCGCAGTTGCLCVVRGSGGIAVTGVGSTDNPYIISGSNSMQTEDSNTIELTLGGSGATNDPYTIRADLTAGLGDLNDVNTGVTTTGYVLARQSGGGFALVPPATAAPGAINVGVGIEGDGSSGNPLRVDLASNSGLIVDANGLRLSGGTAWTNYTPTIYRTTGGTVSIGNSVLVGRYAQLGKTVHVSFHLTVGSTFVPGSGTYQVSLPVPSASHEQVLHGFVKDGSMTDWTGEFPVTVTLEGDGRMTRLKMLRGDSLVAIGAVRPAWVVGTRISISGTYEAA